MEEEESATVNVEMQDPDSFSSPEAYSAELKARLKHLTKKNDAGFRHLTTGGARIADIAILATRCELLIDFLLGAEEQTDNRTLYEIGFAHKFHDLLNKANIEMITQGVSHVSSNGSGRRK